MPKVFNAGKIMPVMFTMMMVISLFLEPLTYMNVNAQNAAEIIHEDDTGSVMNYEESQEYEDSIISKNATYTGTPGEYFIDLRVEGKERGVDESTDIVIVYDNSNSMSTNNRVTTARNATTQFIDEMIENNEQVQIATVIYGTHVMDGRRNIARNAGNTENLSQKTLTRDAEALKRSLPTSIPSNRGRGDDGGTFTQEGIEVAASILNGSTAQNKIIVTITDGVPTVSKNTSNTVIGNGTSFIAGNTNHGVGTLRAANAIQASGIDMHSIGIEITAGSNATETQAHNVMSGLASNPGQYYQAERVSDIVDILSGLATGLTGTISSGSIVDPMGEMVNLNIHPNGFVPASDENLTNGSYYISGTPQTAVDAAGVSLSGDTLNVNNLNLGANQYINIRYKVNLDTDNPAFSADEYYATNGQTTFLATPEDSVYRDFEVPTIKGADFELGGTKVWNDSGGEMNRPETLEIELHRMIDGDENRTQYLETVEVSPNENEEWNYIFEDYPMYSSTGELYDYYINEISVDGYTAEYDEDLNLVNNLEYEPQISLEKTSDVERISEAGEAVVYTFEITNTGNVILSDIVLNDEKLGGNITLENTSLEPGETITVTEEYTVTQADIDNAALENTATVTGIDPEDTGVEDADSNTIPATQLASIDLVKEADRDDLVAGENVNYTFTATNDGNVTLSNISISDVLEGLSDITYAAINGEEIADPENITLMPGDVLTADAFYQITQADLNAGEVENTATVTGTDPSEEPVTDTDTEYIVGEQVPGIQITKTSDVQEFTAVGEEITYTFEVENTGNVTLEDVIVTDPMFEEGISLETTTLNPNESTTGTAVYQVTQNDLDNGTILNTASVTGTPPGGETPPTDETEIIIPAAQNPSIELVKSADTDENLTAGDNITYTFTATNNGNVTLNNVVITDLLEGLSDIQYLEINGEAIEDLENISLSPTDILTAQATYTVTQQDVDNGAITNTATVTGQDTNSNEVSDNDEEVIELNQNAGIEIVKSADAETFSEVNQQIEYTFEVTNTGNVTLNNITVEDEMFTEGVTVTPSSLEPGQTATGTAVRTVTQEDLNTGSIYNSATATGTPSGDITPPSAEDEITINAEQEPSIVIEKTADSLDLIAGEDVNYQFIVTNDGNVTLDNVAISDVMEGLSDITYVTVNDIVVEDPENITLNPNDVLTASANYNITQTDVNTGAVNNTATVTGTPPAGEPLTSEDDETVTGQRQPAIEINKTINAESFSAAGQTVEYTFEVINTGNVTLQNVVVTDPMFEEGIELEESTLQPGQSTTGTMVYEITQTDVNNGALSNTASVTGTPPEGTEPPTDEDEVIIEAGQNPSISLLKEADRNDLAAGEDINYTFTATNDGNVTLTNVNITDVFEGLSDISYATLNGETIEDAESITLNPGDVLVANASYEIKQNDVDAGQLTNEATVTGTPPTGDDVTSTNSVAVPQDPQPGLSLNKTSPTESFNAIGDEIVYNFEIINEGNVTVSGLTLIDEMFPDGIEVEPTTLAPGETATGTATYTVTQEDLDAGEVLNAASVTGTPPDGETEVPPGEDEVTVPGEQNPSINLIKTSDRDDLVAGEDINYTFTATNDGNVTLENVTLTDVLEGLSEVSYVSIDGEEIEDTENITLLPGQELIASANYEITQSNVDSGQLTNEATITGTPPNGDDVTSTDSVAVPQDPEPGLSLNKTSSTESFNAVGDEIIYNFEIVNEGNVTISGLTLLDEMFPDGVEVEPTTIGPNETATGTETYTVTQEDLDAGEVLNAASVTGTPPDGETEVPPSEDEVTVPGEQNPSINLVKESDRNDLVAGEDINYTFTATNDGNQTLTNVNIIDVLDGLSNISYVTVNDEAIEDAENITLNPNDVLVANADYTITQSDVDAGQVTNNATVTGTPQNGENVKSEDSVSVPQDPQPGLALSKTSSTESYSAVGDEIVYNFEIINEGNVTVSGLTLIDEMFPDGVEVEPTTLAPGETATGIATYTVTQEDLNAGEVLNAASVTGTPPDGETEVPPGEDEVTVPGEQNPSINLIKESDRDDLVAGEDINYTFTVTNDGNVTLEDVTLSDVLEGLSDISYVTINDEAIEEARIITLNPGDILVANANYEMTQDDVDAGQLTNNATVTGTPPNGENVKSEDSVSVPQDPQPGLSLSKTSPTESFSAVGDEIVYNFEIVNEGNVTVSGLTLIDEMFPDGVEVEPTTLAPNETATGTATYTVTQEDLDAGEVLNAASVTGTPPDGETEVPPGEDEVTVPGEQNPSINLIKESDRDDLVAGEDINYTFTATNDGNQTLTNVSITDVMEGLGDITYATLNGETIENAESITLNPGDVLVANASYEITQNDVNKQLVVNTATVTGTPPNGEDVTEEDSVTIAGENSKSLTFEKTSLTESYTKVGDTIEYAFTVTNNGDITLENVTVTDEMFSQGIELDQTTLEPGETATGNAEYIVTQEDIDNGSVLNAATATGTPPGTDEPIEPVPDEVTVPHVPTEPADASVQLEKSSDVASVNEAGKTINYTFVVTNTGDAAFNHLILYDAMLGGLIELEVTELAPGESTQVTVPYTVTMKDIVSGNIYNEADIRAYTPDNQRTVDQSENNISTPGPSVPQGEATKTVNGYDKHAVSSNDEVFTFEMKTVLDAVNDVTAFTISDTVDNRLNIGNVDVTIAESAATDSNEVAELEENKFSLETQLESLETELEKLEALEAEQQTEEIEEDETSDTEEEQNSSDTQPETEQTESVDELATEEIEDQQEEAAVTEEITDESAVEEAPSTEADSEAEVPVSEPAEDVETETPEGESAEDIETDESVKAEGTVVNPQVIEELETDIAELETQLEEIEQQLGEVEQVEIPAGSILEFGDLSTSGNNITFNITDEKVLEALTGYEITMVIDSSFANIDEDAEKNGVRNQATFNIGNKTLKTNEVVVVPHVETNIPERPEEPEPDKPEGPSEPEEKPDKPEGPSGPEEKPDKPEGPSEPEEKPAKPEGPSEPEEKPAKPEGPSEPEGKPAKPESSSEPEGKPAKPESPSEPEGKPAKPESSSDSGETQVKPEEQQEINTASANSQPEADAALPDTGEAQNSLLYVGSILVLLAGGALLFITRKKKYEDK